MANGQIVTQNQAPLGEFATLARQRAANRQADIQAQTTPTQPQLGEFGALVKQRASQQAIPAATQIPSTLTTTPSGFPCMCYVWFDVVWCMYVCVCICTACV